jgi:RNA polymerase sigma-70 factor (ECF subfamily)
MAVHDSIYVQQCLERLRQGDAGARDDLIRAACDRLTELTHAMFKSYNRLRRWEETDDVLQSALVRLHRALGTIAPETPRDFYRLATTQIRRELIDMTRHYYGPQGPARRHESARSSELGGTPDGSAAGSGNSTLDPSQLAVWTDFHRKAEALSEDEREVFDLVWYQGLKQNEAADLLGLSARTVLRRWQSACFKLHDAMQGILPGN